MIGYFLVTHGTSNATFRTKMIVFLASIFVYFTALVLNIIRLVELAKYDGNSPNPLHFSFVIQEILGNALHVIVKFAHSK